MSMVHGGGSMHGFFNILYLTGLPPGKQARHISHQAVVQRRTNADATDMQQICSSVQTGRQKPSTALHHKDDSTAADILLMLQVC